MNKKFSKKEIDCGLMFKRFFLFLKSVLNISGAKK